MPKSCQSDEEPQTKAKQQPTNNEEEPAPDSSSEKQDKPKLINTNFKQKEKKLSEQNSQNQEYNQQLREPGDAGEPDQNDLLQQMNPNEKVQQGQAFMLPEQREVDKNNPKYHFCRFISRHYRLIEDKKDRKHHFVRLQPVFVRFLHVLKLHNLPLITIDTFRKYFKKFFKRRGIKYEETTNRVDMKVVVGIDRRYNSKFQF